MLIDLRSSMEGSWVRRVDMTVVHKSWSQVLFQRTGRAESFDLRFVNVGS